MCDFDFRVQRAEESEVAPRVEGLVADRLVGGAQWRVGPHDGVGFRCASATAGGAEAVDVAGENEGARPAHLRAERGLGERCDERARGTTGAKVDVNGEGRITGLQD